MVAIALSLPELPFIRITNKPIIKKDGSFRTRVMTTQKRKTAHETTEGPHRGSNMS
jgi:hypothetical protein